MYFKVFLEILVACFAFFGIICFFRVIGVVWFRYDNVCITVDVDSPDTAENIERYIREAETVRLIRGGEIAVIVRREYSSEKLLVKLEKRRIKYFVV